MENLIQTETASDAVEARTNRLEAEREDLYAMARRVVNWAIERGLMKRPAKGKQQEQQHER